MDDPETLRIMIKGFRVAELQNLLGYAQRNRTGNKSDLFKRALTLIQNPQPSIIVKIHEIHRNQYKTKPNQVPNPYSPALTQWGTEFIPLVQGSYMQDNNTFNKDMLSKPLLMPSVPVNPDVRFIQLPFYEEMGEILKATSLLTSHTSSRIQMSHFEFHLTPQQITEISRSRSGFGSKMTYSIQVHVRFCLMETTCEQNDYYPPYLSIRVNDRINQTINTAPRPGQPEKKVQHAYPVDITNQIKLTPTQSNRLTVEWMSDFGKSFVCRIALVRKLTANVLLKRLRARGFKPADYTRGLIKEKLAAEAEDSEITCSSWRVTVTCPLSKCRITEPCRPSGCRHLQCFDASVFLKMNECKPRWQCPICDQPALYKDLTLDGYFAEILNSPKLTSSNELFIDRDGSWHQNAEVKEEDNSNDADIVILDDTDANIEKNDIVECIADTPPSSSADPEPFVVDLTASDSEEDDIPLSVIAQSMRRTEQPIVDAGRPQDVSRTPSTDSDVMVVE
ncbi:E3 SUMO-protein ligase PIAS1-like [Ctenocephalides felis]|uniref:E3 SUMO-protein ligase PIAS1-like n=1 Tax=Ctenocephalides felis TaxID=7515 RepID=UPI000E6E2784|nr:E3 SUMO-protein ligase PIAS1-like [Ctenocephalides felis]XP_026467001.1 E3 SUMO-protein ligase PIAS1-like [Ctenocephalides felis]